MNIRKRTWKWKGERGIAWRLDWRANGKRHQKQFKTRQEAELYRDALIQDRYARDYGSLKPSGTFREFWQIYLEKRPWRSESYRERAYYLIRNIPFADRPLTEIGPEDIERYRAQRLAEVTASTALVDFVMLSNIFQWAVKLHYLAKNPAREVEKPHVVTKQDDPAEYLPAEDFQALLAVAGQDKPLYEVAVWTGLRESELLALEWPDIRDGYLAVRSGKGKKQRIVPLLPQAVTALRTVPRRLNEQRIFWWRRTRNEVYRHFKRHARTAGLNPKYYFHHLRHSFGSYAAMSGVDLKVIAEAMGHSTTAVTKRYAHLSPTYQRNELFRMVNFLRAGTRKGQERAKPSK